MKVVTQLRITLIMVMVLGLVGASLAAWNLDRSRSHVRLINLSHSIYETYLSLESHTYQLFKQYGDAIIIGDVNQRAGKQILIAQIDSDTELIKQLIGQKIALAGDSSSSKLDALSVIDANVKKLITRLDQFSPTGTGELKSDWGRLSLLLNDEIDMGFRGLIQSALDAEKLDVTTNVESINKEMVRQRSLAMGFAILTALAVVGVVVLLNRRVTQPINTLLAGVRKFGEGEFDFRINASGRDEFAEIGATFDVMAERVAQKANLLSSEKEVLTSAVAERTQRLSLIVEELRQSDNSRQRMIADVSHELRTPLTIIKGEADIALRGTEKKPVVYQDALKRVRDAANHTARLVDDLLFVARNEAGEIQLNLSDIDLQHVISEARSTFGHDVPIESDCSTALIQGDAGRIRQALLVLLENARHHGGEKIKLTLESMRDGFSVCVEDSGPGMDDHEKTQAFTRFFRGSNAAERYKDGAGLGLPVALSIAQAHGGTIKLLDRPGGGLIASLQLPELGGRYG